MAQDEVDFARWLRAQACREDAVGAIAKTAEGETCWKDEVGLWRWLTMRRFPPEALAALVHAVAEFRGRPPTSGLTPDEHRAIGLRLQGTQAELYRLIFDVGAGYPLSDPACVALIAALQRVREACERLLNCVDEEHGADGPSGAYYGERVRVRFDVTDQIETEPPPQCVRNYDSDARGQVSRPILPTNVVVFPTRR